MITHHTVFKLRRLPRTHPAKNNVGLQEGRNYGKHFRSCLQGIFRYLLSPGYAKKGEAKFKVTMRIREGSHRRLRDSRYLDIKGIFVKFGGRRALQERSDDHANTEQYDY